MKHANTYNRITYHYQLVSSGVAKVGHPGTHAHQLDIVPLKNCFSKIK